MQDGCSVTRDLIGVTLECLNAEFSKTLALQSQQTPQKQNPEGLGPCIAQRLQLTAEIPCVSVITDVLCSSGIAEKTEIADSASHRLNRGVRLLPPWTWHGASAPLPAEPWMSLCPVCRTGILNRMSGKQLFGIPHTDYYVECTHCGAKFIPEKDQFCLVSIAKIRDPVWKHNLNKSYSPESWMEIARASGTGTAKRASIPSVHRSSPAFPFSAPHSSPPVRNPFVSVVLKTGALLYMKDGSLGVPLLD
jgi:hypothetical protein